MSSVYVIRNEDDGYVYIINPDRGSVADAYIKIIMKLSSKNNFESRIKKIIKKCKEFLELNGPSGMTFIQIFSGYLNNDNIEFVKFNLVSIEDQMRDKGAQYSCYTLEILHDNPNEIVFHSDHNDERFSCPLLIQLNKILKQYSTEGNSFLEEK